MSRIIWTHGFIGRTGGVAADVLRAQTVGILAGRVHVLFVKNRGIVGREHGPGERRPVGAFVTGDDD
ncbi:hypothetical protein [Leifsonia sp. ALI-44-B]|uniref:hypothetical protein n=1 Tax=Leifsonia sp. ALI-44-B TaxID=1933776 RepID=UPI00097C9722|nr:hypothetical protein [Leifsonia sp. ALI-44-B]